MRLFIAINFDEKTKDKIQEVQEKMKLISRGNYTKRENLHLTLAFLGEIPEDRIEDIKNAINSVEVPEMKLIFSKTGCFNRDSELWWIGIKQNKELTKMQKELVNTLKENGFKIESRKFVPHITIARETRIKYSGLEFLENEFTSQKINSIDLMLSERVNGKLQYKKLYCTNK